ncbi:unnamed protein product [Soboliphyme baturini]|uniref:Uncharacterized protein n=1 Tax=Soboliphyme baturini TaxID=241478 RepID=A0A183J2J7_9BILA|nr:unnamed protein product [Soboliphyme baturini]
MGSTVDTRKVEDSMSLVEALKVENLPCVEESLLEWVVCASESFIGVCSIVDCFDVIGPELDGLSDFTDSVFDENITEECVVFTRGRFVDAVDSIVRVSEVFNLLVDDSTLSVQRSDVEGDLTVVERTNE